MRKALLDILVDPIDRRPLTLIDPCDDTAGEIVSGGLRSAAGRRYEIHEEIPRFVVTEDASQLQVERSFAFKWQQQHTYTSPGMVVWPRPQRALSISWTPGLPRSPLP